MRYKENLVTIALGALVGGLLVAIMMFGAVYNVPDSDLYPMGMAVLAATFALGTYAKLYRVGWGEVILILLATGAGLFGRWKFGFPHGILEDYAWLFLETYLLFYWAVKRKRKKAAADVGAG